MNIRTVNELSSCLKFKRQENKTKITHSPNLFWWEKTHWWYNVKRNVHVLNYISDIFIKRKPRSIMINTVFEKSLEYTNSLLNDMVTITHGAFKLR